jgi:hypothetical protein
VEAGTICVTIGRLYRQLRRQVEEKEAQQKALYQKLI